MIIYYRRCRFLRNILIINTMLFVYLFLFFFNNASYRWIFILCVEVVNIIISNTTIFKKLSMSYSLSIMLLF
nr:MAG TPA: hypothetical protein [Caudoviricetes sp.]